MTHLDPQEVSGRSPKKGYSRATVDEWGGGAASRAKRRPPVCRQGFKPGCGDLSHSSARKGAGEGARPIVGWRPLSAVTGSCQRQPSVSPPGWRATSGVCLDFRRGPANSSGDFVDEGPSPAPASASPGCVTFPPGPVQRFFRRVISATSGVLWRSASRP